jgi:adenylate cyclase
MGTEIERKFLVRDRPTATELGRGEHLRQGYLAEDNGVELRIRISADAAVLTVKAGAGMSRTEVEVAIDADEAEALWHHTEGRRLEKTRHLVSLGALTAELDVYDGALDGLLTVEVEFGSAAAAHEFRAPPWFGRELTGRSEWSNASLARHGLPSDRDA